MDRKQQRNNKGLAPFASVEDLSDDSPPDDKCRLTLPGIREDGAGGGAGPTTGLTTPAHRAIAPRIDISRASSSSHHDDSSPERELFGGADGANLGTKYDLGFSEEMALELRSSTEELDFHDPTENETKARRKKLQQQQAVTKYELEAQSEKEVNERKDSGCSEGGLLLSISGRTSRLSSIGSAASGGSAASHVSAQSHLSGVSHLSATSHLSAASNYSKASRCSSPHRMMLETSFCGPKPIPTVSLEAEYPPKESVEAALLARKSDPTGAVLPPEESINVTRHNSGKIYGGRSSLDVKPKTESKPRSGSRSEAQNRSGASKNKRDREDELVRIIPLHGSIDEPDDGNSTIERRSPPSSPLIHEGIYIPLKGPDPRPQERSGSHIEESDLVKFISLHGDDDEALARGKPLETTQPNCRNSHSVHFKHLPQQEKTRVQTGRDKHPGNKSKAGESEGETKTKKDSKNKSVFTSLFKKTPKEKESHTQKCPEKVTYDSKITNVEFKFNQEVVPVDKDTIIIPLHSPDSIIEPLDLNYNQEESETKSKDEPIEPPPIVNRTETQATKNKLVPQSLEKNVVIVDVINEDNKESDSAKVERQVMVVSSPSIRNELKLERFETEPKVLKSLSSGAAGGEEEEAGGDEMLEETPEEGEAAQGEPRPLTEPTGAGEPEAHRSSESEQDSEIGQAAGPPNTAEEEDDYERKGLFHQTDSIEEELPYVPTTLPQERSVAVPIVPVRERLAQVKTCPIERPRSTTPINPSTLDKYAASHDDPSTQLTQSEKMQITLPRSDSIGKSKSPGRSKQPWMQFAETCLQSPKEARKGRPSSPGSSGAPPPLPPRGAPAPGPGAATAPWVSFDELPERRRAPKRITTLPLRPAQHHVPSNIVYSYVNPEECSCECHENQGKLNNSHCQSDKGHCSYGQQDGRTEREKHFRS